MAGLKREISLTAATAIVVGSVIGAGIFRTPSTVAAQFPSWGWILALWVLGGLVTLAGALTVAELAAMYPRAGGPYVFVREAFGEVPGFLAGWTYFILGKLAIGAAVAIVFAEHASYLLPLTDRGVLLLAAWALCALTFVNWMGVRLGAGVNTFLTAIKALSLAAVLALVVFFDPATAPRAPSVVGAGGLSVALLAVLYAYNSWINATIVGEEVKDPARNLPRALFFGTLLTMFLYVGANVSYLWILGPEGMAANPLVAAAAAERVFGWGGIFVAGAVLVSTFGNLNGGILSGARLPYGMARDGFLPATFARLNRRDVPGAALLLELLPMLGLVFLLRTFDALAAAATFASWVILLAVGVGFFRLRRGQPEAARPYRVHGYPWVPLVFVLSALFVVGLTLVDAISKPQARAGLLLTAFVLAVGGLLLVFRRAPQAAEAPAVAEAP